LIIYLLLIRLFAPKTALFAASILAVHPITTESVTWISGGPYVQYSFFFMLSLYLYNCCAGNAGFYLLSVLSFILSLASGEKAVVFPLVLFLFIISRGELRAKWKKVIPFLIVSLIFGALTLSKLPERMQILESAYYQKPHILNPLVQIPVAITSYLQLIFWPKDLTLYHSEMFFLPWEYYLRLIIFVLFLGGTAYAWRRNHSIFFWLSFFVITLLPTLTPWGISWIVAERYAYLGTIGIFVVVAMGLQGLSEIKKLRLGVNIAFSLIIVLLATRTVYRNIDWKNEDNLWLATARISPSSPNTHNNLGDVFSRRGNLEKAVEEFKIAIKLDPGYADAYHNLGASLRQMGRSEEAMKSYQKAISLNPQLWQSYQNLAAIYFERGNYKFAEELLMEAVIINPQSSSLHTNLAVVYARAGETEKAKEELKKAILLEPGATRAKELLANLN
jgi:tetratricopeptide (TPR) repeat protein